MHRIFFKFFYRNPMTKRFEEHKTLINLAMWIGHLGGQIIPRIGKKKNTLPLRKLKDILSITNKTELYKPKKMEIQKNVLKNWLLLLLIPKK